MFWKKKDEKKFSSIEVAICSLLIHAAKTDEDYQELEKQLIKDFLSSFTSKDKKYIEELCDQLFLFDWLGDFFL